MIDRSPDFENLGKICFVIKDNPAKIEIKGTGFFISTSGIALTAWHVIKGLNQQAIPIRFEKRSSQDERPQAIITQASVKCYSEKYDLAVISVKDIMLTDGDIIPITSDFLPGDEVLVTGYQEQDYMLGLNSCEMRVHPDKAIKSIMLEGETEYIKRIVLVPKDINDVILNGTSGGPVFNKETKSIIGVVQGTSGLQGLKGNKGLGYALAFVNLPRELDELTQRLS